MKDLTDGACSSRVGRAEIAVLRHIPFLACADIHEIRSRVFRRSISLPLQAVGYGMVVVFGGHLE